MIYMVEITFGSAEHEAEWNEWYASHQHTLLKPPGIETSQRFETLPGVPRRYLACYSVTSPDVFTSADYAAIGGGGIASVRWKAFIKRRRTLFDGLDRVPEIAADHCLILADDLATPPVLPNILFTKLHPVALDMQPARRFLAAASLREVERLDLIKRQDIAIYRPRGARLTSSRTRDAA